MRNRFLFTIGAFLLWCCVLTGCKQETVPAQLSSGAAGSSESSLLSVESSSDTMPDGFVVTEYQPRCFGEFYCPPSLLGDEYLLSGQKNAAAVSADTLEEKELDFFAYELQADLDHYYWMRWESAEDALDHNKIEAELMQTDKETLDSRVLLTIEDGSSVMTRLSIYNSFLVWLEEHGDETPLWYIQKYDLKTGELSTVATTDYMFSPYLKIKIRNGWLAYAKMENEKYRIYCSNIAEGTQFKTELLLDTEPVGLVTTGDLLLYSDDTGVFLFRLSNGEQDQIAEKGTDVDFLTNRYAVFMSGFEMNIYDLEQQRLVYQSDENDGKNYVNWFNVNEDGTKAIFSTYEPEARERVYFISTLTVNPA